MKHLLTLITIAFSVTALFAQGSGKAKEILDKVSAKTKSYTTIKTDFNFTHKNIHENLEETMKGSIILKGNKYVLTLSPMTITSDAKEIWNYNEETQEVTITSFDSNEEDILDPSKMFDIYNDGFKLKFVQERFEKGRAIYVIDLFPKNVKESEYSKIQLHIDKDKLQIVQINYHGKDANRFIIDLVNMKTNEAVPDTKFVHNKKNYPADTEFTNLID